MLETSYDTKIQVYSTLARAGILGLYNVNHMDMTA